jgi:hypothetical protein
MAMAINLTAPPEFEYSGDSRATAGVRWPIWKRRLEGFLKATGVKEDEQMCLIMLNQIGSEVQEVFYSNWPNVKSYKEAIEKLDAFFSTKKNKRLCILEFRETKQKDGESIAEFARRLRVAAVPCEFGDMAGDEIKLQLFQGTKDEAVRKEILAAKDNDSVDDILGRVREIALIANSIRVTAKAPTISGEPINAIGKFQNGSKSFESKKWDKQDKDDRASNRKCFKCGGQFPHKGPAIGKKCNECHQRDHYAVCCPMRGKSRHDGGKPGGRSSHKNIRTVAQETPADDSDDNYLFTVTKRVKKCAPRAEIQINGNAVSMIIDSGAAENIIDEAALELIEPKPNLRPPESKLYPFGEGAKEVKQLGQFEATLEANGHHTLADTIRVVRGRTGCLLSHSAAVQLDMYSTRLFQRLAAVDSGASQLARRFPTVFQKSVGKLKDFQVHLFVNKQ